MHVSLCAGCYHTLVMNYSSRISKRTFICEGCGRESTFHRAEFQHKGHALLTVCTAGLWSVSWLSAALGHAMQPWTCSACSHKQKAPKALPEW